MHVKIKNGDDDIIMNKGLTMVLEYDKKAKEERMKGLRENRSDTILYAGNIAL